MDTLTGIFFFLNIMFLISRSFIAAASCILLFYILSNLFSVFTDAFYDIITVGAPAAHFQGFKCGGLQRLLSRYETEKKR